jgi:lysophospholipid acyltransferase
VEGAKSIKEVLDNWNINTQKWLVYCCYERTGSMGNPKVEQKKRRGNVMATMLLSAVWHGPYLGYAMSFLTVSFVVEGARKIRSHLRPMVISADEDKAVKAGAPQSFKKNCYDVITWFTTMCVLNYLVGPFVMLTVTKSIAYWQAFYFVPHLFIVGSAFLPKPKAKKLD